MSASSAHTKTEEARAKALNHKSEREQILDSIKAAAMGRVDRMKALAKSLRKSAGVEDQPSTPGAKKASGGEAEGGCCVIS